MLEFKRSVRLLYYLITRFNHPPPRGCDVLAEFYEQIRDDFLLRL